MITIKDCFTGFLLTWSLLISCFNSLDKFYQFEVTSIKSDQ